MYKSYFFSSPLMLKVKWKWKLSCVWLFVTPRTVVHGILQAGILEWVIFPFFRNLPNPGIEPRSPSLQVDSFPAEPQGSPVLKVTVCFRLLSFSCSVISDSLETHGLEPTRLLCPRDFPGKNTGVGCHFLLQGSRPNPRIEPESPASPALTGSFFTTELPGKPFCCCCCCCC